jgi:hypothetical protein
MSQEVVQWLREIQELKQQLAMAQQAQATADASADNWRRLYETEAQQRRTEANSTRQMMAELRAELAALKGLPESPDAAPIATTAIAPAIAEFSTLEQLRNKLLEVWTERDRLAQALKIEQANHVQTRKNLTMALGDTMEILKTRLKQDEVEEMAAPEDASSEPSDSNAASDDGAGLSFKL